MLNEIERILVALYDNPAKTRHVIDRAGIPVDRIDMDGAMRDVWHSVVTEAERRRQLPDLIRTVVSDYPQRGELWEILYRPERSDKDRWFPMSPRGEIQRNDADALTRLENSVTRLDQIVNGTDWGAEGLLIRVEKLQKNQTFNRRLLWGLAVVNAILVLTNAIALSGIWRPVG